MIETFLELSYIISYPGIVTLAWVLTEGTKLLLDKLKPDNKTRYVVLAWVLILVSIRAVVKISEFEIITFISILTIIVEWLFNTFIIWFGLMEAHGYFTQKISNLKE